MSPLRARILSIVAAKLGSDVDVSEDMTLGDMGIDSLFAAELVLDVEDQIGKPLDTNQLARCLRADLRFGDLIGGLEAAVLRPGVA
jgi:acyl carrier protein